MTVEQQDVRKEPSWRDLDLNLTSPRSRSVALGRRLRLPASQCLTGNHLWHR